MDHMKFKDDDEFIEWARKELEGIHELRALLLNGQKLTEDQAGEYNRLCEIKGELRISLSEKIADNMHAQIAAEDRNDQEEVARLDAVIKSLVAEKHGL